jgi:NAD(P)-dependent dehydrogenase (short-subunit alcohol dehydrogenase family)
MSDMSKKLTKKLAPAAGRSCDIGLGTSKRFLAKGDPAFITRRRKQEHNYAATHINQNVTLIQGEIADLSDLGLTCATAGTVEGLEVLMLQKLTMSHWIFVG